MGQEPAFDLESKTTDAFEEKDTFNGNVLRGFICKSPNRKYGMLHITHVNGRECPQNAFATPKQHYPFDDKGKWIRIDDVDRIEAYAKVDGTNVLCYRYHDADGKTFVGYKTRLRPVLGSSQFGDFASMWADVLKMHPEIPDLVERNGCNLSFEMVGSRNKVLVDYDFPLDAFLLFGVTPDGRVIPPTALQTGGLKHPPLLKVLEKENFQQRYEELRQELCRQLRVELDDGSVKDGTYRSKDEDGSPKVKSVRGHEGAVLYFVRGDDSFQYKCKPDTVLEVHWAEGGIPYSSIYTTVVNAFEQTDEPTFELVVDMLREEFQDAEIFKKAITIRRTVAEQLFERKMKAELFAHYRERGFDIVRDRATCMRWFGQRYDRKLSAKIFTYLWRQFGEAR